MKPLKIATDYKINDCKLWNSMVNFIILNLRHSFVKNKFIRGFLKNLDEFVFLFTLIKRRKEFDLYILYRTRPSILFGLIQGLMSKKIKLIIINYLWRLPKSRVLKYFIQFQLSILIRGVDKFIVYASQEKVDYYKLFNVPQYKFIYIPHYFTPAASKYKAKQGDYIFSGGYHAYRDYRSLIDAVRGLDIKCKIATQFPENFPRIDIPYNVEIGYLSQDEFFRSMAESKMVVIPLKEDHFRATGQRTYLNAMLMGKPLIICDNKGVYDYINNNMEALIIPPGDVEKLRAAIQKLLNSSHHELSVMTERAKEKAKKFTIDNTMGQILELAQEVCKNKW